ncbi:MAG: hypothetical protein JRE64_14055, partial [Deltaproteobacteria bacterium]|nr:hypothetical protein [Deltaproteobacteria bacterium]
MMGEWREIITTRKSSFAVGLAGGICSTNYVEQEFEKSQQTVGQISSQALLQSEKPIAKQAAAQLVQIPLGQNVTKNLPDEFRSS